MKRMNVFFLLLASICLNQNAAYAQAMAEPIQSVNSELSLMVMTTHRYEQLPIEQQRSLAKVWSLESKDYHHYLWLMQNTPNSFYYADKHLDPSWILGFNASSDEERKKYAVIAIQNERTRIEKELVFQRVFYEVQQALHPNELPISYAAVNEKSKLDHDKK